MAEKQTIARPYAIAAFEYAKESNQLEQWSQCLSTYAQVSAAEEMKDILSSPSIGRDKLVELFSSFTEGVSDQSLHNFLKIVAENRRLGVMPQIFELFEIEHAAIAGEIEAEVISAVELSSEQQQKLKDSLSKRLGQNVTLQCSVDTELLGGAIIRTGDMVIDSSIAAKVDKMAKELVH